MRKTKQITAAAKSNLCNS